MPAIYQTRGIRRYRALALSTCALVLLSLLAFHYRLALQPDRVVADGLTRTLRDIEDPEVARSLLAKRYKVGSVCVGSPWETQPTFEVPSDARCFTVLVGTYGLLFTTSVEAMIVFRTDGHLNRVLIRRTVDAL